MVISYSVMSLLAFSSNRNQNLHQDFSPFRNIMETNVLIYTTQGDQLS